MISIKINDLKFLVKPGISILEACKYIGITIPRFCYHETLSIAGNCRMCLVELEGLEKPVASCLTEISEGTSVYTDSAFVKKARENVVETLLLNHPLDCPICDQAGECDLQDQTKSFGSDYSRFFFNKRGVEDKECGPLIKTIMTRCIHCTRCVRFGSEVAGIDFLGTLNRGTSTEIGSYVSKFFDSEISGNVIDLCPVGALTSKPYGFKARPWELRVSESIDLTDSTGSNIYVNFKESEIFRVLPKSNEDINEHIISDKSRFSYDANNNNRIKNLFEFQNKKDKFKTINWTSFFTQIDLILDDKNKNFNITINEDIGFENLEFLKKITRFNKNIHINSLKGNVKTNNFYSYGLTDKINVIESCNSVAFIFSVNPKLECSVINTRLRTKYRNSLLSLVGLNQSFSYNIPTKFINLNLSKSLKIFEGKYNFFSRICINSESPLVLISDSFGKRGINTGEILSYLKLHFDTIKIIKINENSNTESLHFSNIRNIVKKYNTDLSNLMCINLDDTYDFRKKFLKLKNNIIWLNSHGSNFASKVKLIVPVLSEFEDERIYLNLEQRPQKTYKIFNSFFDSRNIKTILLSAFENNNIDNNSLHSKFLYEMIENPLLFDGLNNNFSFLCYGDKKSYNTINYLYKYPTKSNIEDFYCSNKSTKNSKIMQQSSQYLRRISSNFR